MDVSVALRVILGQAGQRAPLGSDNVIVSSDLLRIEVARALDRLRVTGVLDDKTHDAKVSAADGLLVTFHLMPLADEMIELARGRYAVEVSAACAIHVATAQLMLDEVDSLQFWTHFRPQAMAALARGLDVRGGAIGS